MAMDGPSTPDAVTRIETSRADTVQASADLQSSRCPPLTRDGSAPELLRTDGGAEPFFREVFLTREDVAGIEATVDSVIDEGGWDAGDRQGLVDAAKDVTFADKARNGDFYAVTLLGTTESSMLNAMPEQWYEEGAESRLFAVTPSPETSYFAAPAAPMGSAQGVHADLPGGGMQVFVPKDTDRTGWEVRAVARSEAELSTLPEGSLTGYDDAGDLVVTPDSAHSADPTVEVHTAAGGNPFELVDNADRITYGDAWNGPTVNKFAGSIEERVTPGTIGGRVGMEAVVPAAAPVDGQGPLLSEDRNGPLVTHGSLSQTVLRGLSDPETVATVADATNVALEAVGVEGVDVRGNEVGGPLSYVADRLLGHLSDDGNAGSPILPDRDGPLIS